MGELIEKGIAGEVTKGDKTCINELLRCHELQSFLGILETDKDK